VVPKNGPASSLVSWDVDLEDLASQNTTTQ
jgi:hypothetical protein